MDIAIFGKRTQDSSKEQISLLFRLLKERGASISVDTRFYDYLRSILPEAPEVDDFIPGNLFRADFALSIGGDGTFLNTASRVGDKGIPILGINTGRLGFLTASDGSDMEELVDEMMTGRLEVESRAQLKLETDSSSIDYPFALNEIAITKRDVSAMLHIHATLNGEYLNDYQADGLLLSTATGSTAYSLSVGGPILMPDSSSYVIVPIAPHSLTIRPLVLDARTVVDLRVESRSHTYLVSLDGRSYSLPMSSELRISSSDFMINIVRRKSQSFLSTLKAKMMWGKDLRYPSI